MRWSIVASLGMALATGALPAQALLIVQTETLSVAGGAPGIVSFQEFDPGLGTLDAVGVEIGGTLQLTGTLAPGGTVAPLVELDVERAGSRGFFFAEPDARFALDPAVNSDVVPLPFVRTTVFGIDIRFDAGSDVIGFDLPSTTTTSGTLTPPAGAVAQRASFIEGLAPIGIFETLVFTPTLPGVSNVRLTVNGFVRLTYDYTPAPQPIPAPGPLALLAAAPLFLAERRRQRRSKAGSERML